MFAAPIAAITIAMHSLWAISPKMRPNAEKRPKYGPTTAAFGAHRSTVIDSVSESTGCVVDCPKQRDATRRVGFHKDVRDESRPVEPAVEQVALQIALQGLSLTGMGWPPT
jgi:hypothetical protein